MFQPIRGRGGHLVFTIGPEYTNLVDDVKILLPVKFCQIPFCGFKKRRHKCQPIKDQGGHLVFLISPKDTNYEEDAKFLIPVKFR